MFSALPYVSKLLGQVVVANCGPATWHIQNCWTEFSLHEAAATAQKRQYRMSLITFFRSVHGGDPAPVPVGRSDQNKDSQSSCTIFN